MRDCFAIMMVVGFVCGCVNSGPRFSAAENVETLTVQWQRLVDEEGQTCDRCGTTETAVENAVQKLRRSLKELDIDVVLEKTSLTPSTFAKDPLQSNRIWIAGKPIENWLSATMGQSQCDATCADSECRTLTVDGKTYEAIPAELIIKAGLLAASQLLHGEPQNACCPTAVSPQESLQSWPPSSCCPK